MRTGHWVTVLATAAAFCLIAFALGMRQTVRQSVPVSPVTTAPVTAPGLSSALGTVPQTGRQVSKAPDVGVGALPTQPALTQEEAEKRRMKDVAQARQYRADEIQAMSTGTREAALNAVTSAVESRLASPRTANWGEPLAASKNGTSNTGSWVISGEVESLSGAGVPIRHRYTAIVLHSRRIGAGARPEDRYEVQGLEVW